MEEIMLKIENVSKEYKLGQIGGTTLRDELQRRSAKRRGLEDPTRKIGAREYTDGETFMALDGVSFEVRKGERVGIIGHNGAGKSTLLKLISRITAPTGGSIYLNGRVASMLEVGTGFHGELTGRENIYMNGAILGMTKKEIDAKIENIIEFSECRQFIDTPVKRYSSGMYVKLAFSVAAHLDSEIMIMDEVLAVGDVNFQQKCIKKMKGLAEEEDRTVLYVSHNMDTIRQLCNRCIVLSHGKISFVGDVEQAISMYSNIEKTERKNLYDVRSLPRSQELKKEAMIETVSVENYMLISGDRLHLKIDVNSTKDFESFLFRIVFFNGRGAAIGTAYTDIISLNQGKNEIPLEIDTSQFAPDSYYMDIILIEYTEGNQYRHDLINRIVVFEIEETQYYYNLPWRTHAWGNVILNPVRIDEMPEHQE